MKKVLIIGGTGTISYPIVQRLSNQKKLDVYVLNRGKKERYLPENVTSIIADIEDETRVEEILKEYTFDVVCDFIVFTKEQLQRDIRLFDGKVKQYIFISTACVLNRTHHLILNEETPSGNCFSAYGREKQACEEILWKQFHKTKFPFTIVRPTQTYGQDRIPLSVKGNSCYSVIKRMLEHKKVIVHGDGTSIWASTHAEDFANMFISLVGNEECIANVYQITSDEVLTWNQIYETLAEVFACEVNIVNIPSAILATSKKYDYVSNLLGDKTQSCIFDNKKIQEVSKETYHITLKEGFIKYREYLKEHPECCKSDDVFDDWCDDVIAQYEQALDTIKIA